MVWSTPGGGMLPGQPVGQRSAESSGRLQVSECSRLAGDAKLGALTHFLVSHECLLLSGEQWNVLRSPARPAFFQCSCWTACSAIG